MLQIKHRARRALTCPLTGNTWQPAGRGEENFGTVREKDGALAALVYGLKGGHGAAVQHDGRQLRGLHC